MLRILLPVSLFASPVSSKRTPIRAARLYSSDQNANLHEYGDQRLTDEQRFHMNRGNRKTFWHLRKTVGDPIAELALAILTDSGVSGRVANWVTGFRNKPKKLTLLFVSLLEMEKNLRTRRNM